MMSRASIGEVFLPGACKNYISGDPLTLFDFELCDEQLRRRPAGDRGRAWPINIEEVTTHRQGEAALDVNRSSAIPDGYLRFHLVLPVAEPSDLFSEARRLG